MGILPISRSLIKAPPTFLLFYFFTFLPFYFYAFFSLCITLPLP
jgi:hypothetical protein